MKFVVCGSVFWLRILVVVVWVRYQRRDVFHVYKQSESQEERE